VQFAEMMNNQTEQLMKQVAIGRKNSLFLGNVAAGERMADVLTLVSSALRKDLDVWAYVKDVLDRLLAGSTDYASLRTPVGLPRTRSRSASTGRRSDATAPPSSTPAVPTAAPPSGHPANRLHRPLVLLSAHLNTRRSRSFHLPSGYP
jgi:hypothetical protein